MKTGGGGDDLFSPSLAEHRGQLSALLPNDFLSFIHGECVSVIWTTDTMAPGVKTRVWTGRLIPSVDFCLR